MLGDGVKAASGYCVNHLISGSMESKVFVQIGSATERRRIYFHELDPLLINDPWVIGDGWMAILAPEARRPLAVSL